MSAIVKPVICTISIWFILENDKHSLLQGNLLIFLILHYCLLKSWENIEKNYVGRFQLLKCENPGMLKQ